MSQGIAIHSTTGVDWMEKPYAEESRWLMIAFMVGAAVGLMGTGVGLVGFFAHQGTLPPFLATLQSLGALSTVGSIFCVIQGAELFVGCIISLLVFGSGVCQEVPEEKDQSSVISLQNEEVTADIPATSLPLQNEEVTAVIPATSLPDETLEHVFSYLDAPSLMIASQVCKRWYRVSYMTFTQSKKTEQWAIGLNWREYYQIRSGEIFDPGMVHGWKSYFFGTKAKTRKERLISVSTKVVVRENQIIDQIGVEDLTVRTFLAYKKRRDNWEHSAPPASIICVQNRIFCSYINPDFINVIDIWDQHKRHYLGELKMPETGNTYILGANRELICAASGTQFYIYDPSTLERAWENDCGGKIMAVAMNSSHLMVSQGSSWKLFDLQTQQIVATRAVTDTRYKFSFIGLNEDAVVVCTQDTKKQEMKTSVEAMKLDKTGRVTTIAFTLYKGQLNNIWVQGLTVFFTPSDMNSGQMWNFRTGQMRSIFKSEFPEKCILSPRYELVLYGSILYSTYSGEHIQFHCDSLC